MADATEKDLEQDAAIKAVKDALDAKDVEQDAMMAQLFERIKKLEDNDVAEEAARNALGQRITDLESVTKRSRKK